MLNRLRLLLLVSLSLSLALAACGDDDNNDTNPDAADSAGTDTDTDTGSGGDGDTDPGVELPPAPEGTRLIFDVSVGEGDVVQDNFFDFPFPADTRLSAEGNLVLDFPTPRGLKLVTDLMAAANQLKGNSLVPVAWFRFDGAVRGQALDEVIAPSVASPAMLVNIDEDSPRYLELAPLIASTLAADEYLPENVLAVAAYAGWILDPSTTYAFVIKRDWGDADGEPLGVAPGLWSMAGGQSSGSAAVDASFAPLWEALEALEIDSDDVAAATVFTTGDPVADMAALSDALLEVYTLSIDGLHVADETGANHERYCELHGTMKVPEFQEGTPPFDTGGLFVDGEDGLPVRQGWTEIPVVINLPLGEMPAEGFPLVMYFHGSGGVSTQVVHRGEDIGEGEDSRTGLGPAHVLARHGLASVGSAHPVNPERLAMVGKSASGFDYLNFANLKAFRDIFRQGIIEQRLFLAALLSLEIAPSVTADCTSLTLPEGAGGFHFSEGPVMAMGQSMGGMFANIMAPVEPRIEAVVPTGAGGHWSRFILITDLIPGVGTLVSSILKVRNLSHVHPALHVLQLAWEPVEAFVYVPRLAWDPLPGHPVRSIYEPVGDRDSYFPQSVFDRIALAYRNQQAGDEIWDTMQGALAWRDLDGFAEYPVSENRTSAAGVEYTGVVVQYPWDGVNNGHNIFQYFDEVKRQYGCFFETYYRTGTATVPDGATGSLADPCPGL